MSIAAPRLHAPNPAEDIHRSMPFSDEAEKSILSCFLQSPNLLDLAAEINLEPEFYHPANQLLFSVLVSMRQSSRPVELPAITQFLIDTERLDKIGGPAMLCQIADFVPTPAHWHYYRGIMADNALLRSIITTSTESVQKCYQYNEDVTALLDDVETRTLAIRPKDSGNQSDALRDHMDGTIGDLMAMIERGDGLTGHSTGFPWLDFITKGIRAELWYIGARPSVGKTSLLLQLLVQLAIRAGLPVGFISLEVKKPQINLKLLSLLSGVSFDRITGGRLNTNEMLAIGEAAKTLKKAKIFYDDRTALTHSQVRAKLRRWKREHGIGAVFLDFLQRMKPTDSKRNRGQHEEHAENSRSMADSVHELEIPHFIAAQLNRMHETQNRPPRMSDFEGCGVIEQDADLCLLMSRNFEQPPDDTISHIMLDVAKQRNGAIGARKHIFSRKEAKFLPHPIDETETEQQPEEVDQGNIKPRKWRSKK